MNIIGINYHIILNSGYEFDTQEIAMLEHGIRFKLSEKTPKGVNSKGNCFVPYNAITLVFITKIEK